MSEALSANQQKTIVVDKVQIIQFSANTYPAQSRGLVVVYAVGYDDEQGNFIPVEKKQKVAQGPEFDALVGANPNSEVSFYENIKAVLYALIDEEQTPAQ